MFIYFPQPDKGYLSASADGILFPIFELGVNDSLIVERYRIINGVLADIYIGKTDQEVVDMLAPPPVMAGAPVSSQDIAIATALASPLNPVAFKLRFTTDERVAIYASTDAYVVDFLRILDDARLAKVIKIDQTLNDGVARLVELNLLTAERASEILNWC
jgi:hypothetical protein